MKILVLDDQRELAEAISRNFEGDGDEAVLFTSAAQALEAIHGYDVLVVNYDMPEMTGVDVARRAYVQGWRGGLYIMSRSITGRDGEPFVHFVLPDGSSGPVAATVRSGE